jgi:hypothetical protein
MANETYGLKSFNYLEDGGVTFSNLDSIRTTKILDSGVYHLDNTGHPTYKTTVKCDNNAETVKDINFPDSDKLDNLFRAFFDDTIKDKIKSLGYYHKIGVLLYGIEGTGKSTILKKYYTEAIKKHNAIVFYIDNYEYFMTTWTFISDIRNIQDNPFIIIFEEIDSLFSTNNSNESRLKTALDGPLSIDNTIYLATTNYIDRIPAAIKDRPSRFKYKFNIEGIQNETSVNAIITEMIGDIVTAEEIANMTKDLKGSSIDVIKHRCLDKIMDLNEHQYKKKTKIGFTIAA